MSVTHTPLCPSGAEAERLFCETPCPERDRPMVLVATILASSMAFIDGTVVQVTLPALQSSLQATFSDLQWIVNGYTLMLGALLLAGGALGDQAGRRKVFAVGTALFALASIACALAPDARSIIASRFIQGTGAALMVPQSLAIIAASFPQSVRGRAIGTWAAFSALTTTAGPVLGGVLVDTASWRAVFWINVPLAIVTLLLTFRYVPESRNPSQHSVDWLGAFLAAVALGALTYALTRWPDIQGDLPRDIWISIVITVTGGIAFVWHERETSAPLLPLVLLRSRLFSGLNAMTLLLYAALSGALFLLPYDLIQVQSYTATEAGFALMPLGLIIGTLSRYSGKLSDRVGPGMLLVAGSLLVATGCALLAVPGIGSNYLYTFAAPVILIALGMAAVVSPLTTAVMNAAPDDHSGTASGINNAASRVAGLFAVALSGAVAVAVFATGLETRLDSLAVHGEIRTRLLANVNRLAEITVPADTANASHAAIHGAIDSAFVAAFRAAVLLNALLAAAAAGIAALLMRSMALADRARPVFQVGEVNRSRKQR